MQFFITGTDTEVGKTYVSVSLLQALKKRSLKTIAMKPIASGCFQKNGKHYNHDALQLQEAASISLPYQKINPLPLPLPIAPHIAADKLQLKLTLKKLNSQVQCLLKHAADVHLVEGVGGWYVPLNDKETMADFAVHNNFKIILVVGMRVGCLNHALLTYEAITRAGGKIVGWIANCLDPEMEFLDENVAMLKKMLNSPCLGVVKYRGEIRDDIVDKLLGNGSE